RSAWLRYRLANRAGNRRQHRRRADRLPKQRPDDPRRPHSSFAKGSPRMIFAVVPAAGKSTRMGRPKLSLPLGNFTVLEMVIGALRQGGVDHVLVVAAPHVGELAPLAQSAGAHALVLPDDTPH